MRFDPRILLAGLLVLVPASLRAGVAAAQAPAIRPVWEVQLQNFDRPIYEREVEALVAAFETAAGRRLVPGAKGKVGLKIYSDSGPGLATPKNLVHGVIAALERRGFRKEKIFLVGLNHLRLRMTGYLPSPLERETQFDGYPLYVLESGRYYDPLWFYDSPLPQTLDFVLAESQIEGISPTSTREQDLRSFLATPLFLDADFWINLPVYTDHAVLGVNGALVNATLWNASNTARVFRSSASAPAAVAEMSAIPELRQTWVFTIASLQRYQFIDGPFFNSLYSASEPLLWLSADPVALDSLMLDRINDWRRRSGFPAVSPDIPTLAYAEQLGVGTATIDPSRIIRVGERIGQ
jgi:hypothetical protein